MVIYIFAAFGLQACQDDEAKEEVQTSILPETMTIDVPAAISSKDGARKRMSAKDVMQGDEIYENQRLFIAVAEEAALIVDDIINAIRGYNINRPLSTTFTGDDQRQKTLVVTENVSYDNKSYRYKLDISDADGKAMQVFWNPSPISGVALLNPYYIDRIDNDENPGLMAKIEYSESDATYEATMTVSLTGWANDNGDDIYAVDKMKMFVGKKGCQVDLYGASNHPRAKLLDNDTLSPGLCWAFTARADDDLDIAVARVALPPNTLNTTNDLFSSYSINKVMTRYITAEYQHYADRGEITQAQLNDSVAAYLVNTKAPGYFNEGMGFISCGDSIPGQRGFDDDAFLDLSGLDTYAPKTVADLEITFQADK